MRIDVDYNSANATPNRNWDFVATLRGYEPPEPIGYGKTKLEEIEQ